MNVVNLGTLLVNVVCVLVLGVWAVEGVAAGAAAAAAVLGTAGVRAMAEEVTALVIALQGAAVLLQPQPVVAAIASHQSVPGMILLMLKGIAAAGVRPEACVRCMFSERSYSLALPARSTET